MCCFVTIINNEQSPKMISILLLFWRLSALAAAQSRIILHQQQNDVMYIFETHIQHSSCINQCSLSVMQRNHCDDNGYVSMKSTALLQQSWNTIYIPHQDSIVVNESVVYARLDCSLTSCQPIFSIDGGENMETILSASPGCSLTSLHDRHTNRLATSYVNDDRHGTSSQPAMLLIKSSNSSAPTIIVSHIEETSKEFHNIPFRQPMTGVLSSPNSLKVFSALLVFVSPCITLASLFFI